MAKKLVKTERIKDDQSNPIQSASPSDAAPALNGAPEPMVDLQEVISGSLSALKAEPIKRKRATKAEMLARQGGQAPSQPTINFSALPEQDFTMATEPLLRGLDILSSNFVASQEQVPSQKLKADVNDLKETAKTLNKPLTILSAHYGAGANPVNGAWFAIGMTLGGMFLGKYFAAQDLKGQTE